MNKQIHYRWMAGRALMEAEPIRQQRLRFIFERRVKEAQLQREYAQARAQRELTQQTH